MLPAGVSSAPITSQLERLREVTRGQDFPAVEQARLARLTARVEDALAGRWTFD